MRLTLNVARVLLESVRFAVATRRMSLLVAIVLGFVVAVVAVATHLLAPLALYPFA